MPSKIKFKEIKQYINDKSTGNSCELLLNEIEFNNEIIRQHKSNTKIKLKIKCHCGEVFYTSFDKFKNQNKKQCTKHKYDIIKHKLYKGKEQFQKELNKKFKDEFLVIGEYINTDTKILIQHNSNRCNNSKWYMQPKNILKSGLCPVCRRLEQSEIQQKTHETFLKEIQIINNEFELLSQYRGAYKPIIVKHKICNNIFTISSARNLLKRTSCPQCNESKGEKEIRMILSKLNIKYAEQYSYKDLYFKDKNFPLRFDFAVLGDNDNVIFLIEYDGEFHYKKIYKEHDLKGQQERDTLKNEYCKLHNIDLLRIPYWDFDNIEQIIKDKIRTASQFSNKISENI